MMYSGAYVILCLPFASVRAALQTHLDPEWARYMWHCYWLPGPANRL